MTNVRCSHKSKQSSPTSLWPLLLFRSPPLPSCNRDLRARQTPLAETMETEMTSTAGADTAGTAGGGGGGEGGPVLNMTLSEALQKWASKHPDKVQ